MPHPTVAAHGSAKMLPACLTPPPCAHFAVMLLLSSWWHFLQPDVSLMLVSEEDAAGGLQHTGPTYVAC
jgi:hypothetical protein